MIELKNIYKTFNPNNVNEVRALQGVTLTLEPGEFVSVIGSNGAGKSSLLNLLAGVYPCDQGSIIIANRDVTRWQEHQRAKMIGRVFQDPLRGTAGSMTIEQNMAMALLRGKRRGLGIGVSNKNRAFFREQLALIGLGLENRLTSRVNLLSGGQRQSLTLLMAALTQPRVLLLDEHTAALDPGTAAQIANLTQKLVQENGLTTLMVTHNMEQALNLGTRTIMMHRGKIILDVRGEERARMTVADLVKKFAENRAVTDVIALSN